MAFHILHSRFPTAAIPTILKPTDSRSKTNDDKNKMKKQTRLSIRGDVASFLQERDWLTDTIIMIGITVDMTMKMTMLMKPHKFLHQTDTTTKQKQDKTKQNRDQDTTETNGRHHRRRHNKPQTIPSQFSILNPLAPL